MGINMILAISFYNQLLKYLGYYLNSLKNPFQEKQCKYGTWADQNTKSVLCDKALKATDFPPVLVPVMCL